MPDLTPQFFYVCKSAVDFEKKVPGSTGEYTVRFGPVHGQDVLYDWTCTCPTSKFRKGKRCKHILEVAKSGEWCGWHQLINGGEPEYDGEGNARCPLCGGETEIEQHGV